MPYNKLYILNIAIKKAFCNINVHIKLTICDDPTGTDAAWRVFSHSICDDPTGTDSVWRVFSASRFTTKIFDSLTHA
jgi:hypothetical protein